MNAAYVLDLSSRGIRVMAGQEQPWQVLGEVSLDDPLLDERLRDLRHAGDAQGIGGPMATVLVPRDEVLFATLDADGDEGDREPRIRAALSAASPVPPDELVVDTGVSPDGHLRIAAVPRHVVQQAQRFVVAHGFHPTRFSARADADVFPGWPDFGPPLSGSDTDSAADDGRAASTRPVAPGPVRSAPSVPDGRRGEPVSGARGAVPAVGAERPMRPRVGPATRSQPSGAVAGAHVVETAARVCAAGERQPIRPDSGEIWGQAQAAADPQPAPRPSGRWAGVAGLAVALLTAAGVWAALLGPFGTNGEPGADRVAFGTEQPASTDPASPATGMDRAARGGDGLTAIPGRTRDTADIGPNAPAEAERIALPITLALAAELPPASDTPEPLSGGPGDPEPVLVTDGRPVIVPPTRPAPPSATDGSAFPTTDEIAPGTEQPIDAEPDTGEEAIAPTAPGTAIATTPRPRPAREATAAPAPEAIETAVRTAVDTRPLSARARPRARPDGAAPDSSGGPAAAESLKADVAAALAAIPPDGPGADALARSLRPGSRPRGLGREEAPAESVRMASAQPPTTPAATGGPAASDATDGDLLRLDQMNLIGVYGSQSDRRALVRLPSGRFVKVRVGDRVDGGRVSAIGSEDLQYIKGGRAVSLSMPRG